MSALTIYIPDHGFSINDLVYVSWLDDNYYVRDNDNSPSISDDSFKISTDTSDDNLVQFVSTITSGYVEFVSAPEPVVGGGQVYDIVVMREGWGF